MVDRAARHSDRTCVVRWPYTTGDGLPRRLTAHLSEDTAEVVEQLDCELIASHRVTGATQLGQPLSKICQFILAHIVSLGCPSRSV